MGQQTGTLEVQVACGLGNRLAGALSAHFLARLAGVPLRILWPREELICAAAWRDLFETEGLPFTVEERKECEALPVLTHQEEIDTILAKLRSGMAVRLHCERLLVPTDPDWEVLGAHRRDFTGALRPTAAVRALMPEIPPGSVGMHVRRTDLFRAQRWSPNWLFADLIAARLKAGEKAPIYLASDDPEVISALMALFPGAVHPLERRKAERVSVAGLQQACALLCSFPRCERILASHGSTFTRSVSILWDKPVETISLRPGDQRWSFDLLDRCADLTHKFDHTQWRFARHPEFTVIRWPLWPFMVWHHRRILSERYQWRHWLPRLRALRQDPGPT